MTNSKRINKYCGKKAMYDPDTGEYSQAIMTEEKKIDINFIKIFLPKENEPMFPKEFSNATKDLFLYLCVVVGKDNVASEPVSQISDRTGLSSASIARAKEQLFGSDYIRQVASNILMINPLMAFKDDGNKRDAAVVKYEQIARHKKRKEAI